MKCLDVIAEYPRLFLAQLKITNRKWSDIQELKAVIPADCHSFYDNLPHD